MAKISIKKIDTDIYFDNVSLLLPFDSNFNDNSKNNFSVTSYGNTQISSTQSKFGGASAYFDGAGDYIRTTISNWNVGVANESFTIEFWVYRLNTNTHVFLSKHGGVTAWNGTDGLQISFFIDSGNVLHFDYYTSGGSLYNTLTNNVSIPINQWVHIAATYDGTITKIFIDGIQQPTTSSTGYGTVTSASIVEIGGENGSFNLNGYIDDLRITKGIARYTSNFTPPKKLELAKIGNKLNIKKVIEGSQVSSISGLSLWLKADAGVTYDGSNNVSNWADQSSNGKNAITVNGGADSPIYVASAINSKPAIRFNNVSRSGNSYMRILTSAFNLKNSSCFIVVKQNSTASTIFGRMLGFLPASGEDYNTNDGLAFLFANINSRLQLESNGNSVIINSALANSFSICSYTIDLSGNINLYYNNDLSGIGSNANMASQNNGNFYIGQGSQLAGAASALDGEIAEIIIYQKELNSTERQVVQNYLNNKYSIYSSPYVPNGKLKISKSTYNPPALGDLKVWLDAKDLSTITKDGSNLVSQWSSKVGSINFTQANNSYKPTYQSAGTSAVNRDCLYFNAGSSYGGSYNLLSSPSSNFTSIGSTATLFAVARALYVGPYTNGTIIGQTNGSPYRRRLQMTSSTMFLQGTNGDYNGGNNPNLGEVNHVNQPLVLVGIAIKSDGTARHYIQSAGTMVCSNGSFGAGSYNFNGTLNRGLIEIAGAASNANMLIGSAFGGGQENLKGEICEILIYNGTLNDSSFDQVIAGLKTKWTL